MLLVVDTSEREGRIALALCGPARSVQLLQQAQLPGGTFSAQLVPEVDRLLSAASLTKRDIEGFVVASGPGSFTGLRIGLAAVKGLAEALLKPIVTVSLLQAVAEASDEEGRLFSALNAGRSEIYLGEFEIKQGPATTVREQLSTLQELTEIVSTASLLVSPDEAVCTEAGKLGVRCRLITRPGIQVIAAIGCRKVQGKQTISSAELDSNYVRSSSQDLFVRSYPEAPDSHNDRS